MVKYLKLFVMGFIIGGSMSVPGVSGGTMAIILGIYDDLIYSTSNIFKQFKKCFLFLLPVGLGGLLGLYAVAKSILRLIEMWEVPMMYFFAGIVIRSLFPLIKKGKIKKFDLNSALWFLLGFGIIVLITVSPTNIFSFNEKLDFTSILILLLAGIIIALAFVLPGISTALMLTILGIYSDIFEAVDNLDFRILIPLAISVLIATISLVKVLEKALKKYPRVMYLLIMGFVAGSLIEIYPGLPIKMEILYAILMFSVGFIIIHIFTKYLDKHEEKLQQLEVNHAE